MSADLDSEKAAAALAAAAFVTSGMLVGLGTGSTSAHVIAEIGRRVRDEGLAVRVVGTSIASERAAIAASLDLLPFTDVDRVDLTIDGIDEIDARLRAIKGGGGAMLREKIVAEASDRMIAIGDSSKPVDVLSRAVPIEVLPFAAAFVARSLRDLGAEPALRTRDGAPARTDQDNLLIDADFGALDDPERLAATLAAIPGVLGHGIFLGEVDCALIACGNVIERMERSSTLDL